MYYIMRTFNSMMKQFKKSLGNKSIAPLILVSLTIVILSMCYKNKNQMLFGAGSMFEGLTEGADGDEEDGFTEGTEHVAVEAGPEEKKEGLVEGDDYEKDTEGFRGLRRRRQGFRGLRRRRQGFREGSSCGAGRRDNEGYEAYMPDTIGAPI